MKTRSATLIASIVVAAGASTSLAQQVLFDTGPAQTSIFNAAPTYLGWSSGSLGASTQRWTAQAFTLSSASTITEIHVQGFVPEATPIQTMNYIIWSRASGNPAPVAADQLLTGSVPLPTPTPDPRVAQTGTQNGAGDFNIVPATPISLPAGDYWLTVYGSDPVTPGGDSNFGWFTNAQLDTMLSPVNTPIPIAGGAYMWRAATFPSPGFVQYTAAVAINTAPGSGPGSAGHTQTAQDPQYLYNASFTLKGEPATTGPTCYANCDNSTNVPFLNVLDFNCFLNQFNAGASYANCDNSTNPPILNVLDFNCFLNKFNTGCTAP